MKFISTAMFLNYSQFIYQKKKKQKNHKPNKQTNNWGCMVET